MELSWTYKRALTYSLAKKKSMECEWAWIFLCFFCVRIEGVFEKRWKGIFEWTCIISLILSIRSISLFLPPFLSLSHRLTRTHTHTHTHTEAWCLSTHALSLSKATDTFNAVHRWLLLKPMLVGQKLILLTTSQSCLPWCLLFWLKALHRTQMVVFTYLRYLIISTCYFYYYYYFLGSHEYSNTVLPGYL